MKLFCKELKGNEIALDNLNEDTLISEVKKQIETELGIPVNQQKLLYLGKILQDSSKLKEYKIQDNAKLMLTKVPKPDLKKAIYTHFSKYYDSETSSQMTSLFIENMRKKINNEYSLDDLERLAEVYLTDSVN